MRLRPGILRTAGLLSFAAITLAVLSCGGGGNKEDKPPFTTDDVAAKSTKPTGEDIYKRVCAACHMASGEGIPNVYPPLAKSDYLADKDRAITQVIKGSSGEITVNGKTYNNTMLPQQLNDEEIAAVLTFVYTSMGNGGTGVTADEVKGVRAKI